MEKSLHDSNYPLVYRAPLKYRIAPVLIAMPLYWLMLLGKARLDNTSPAWLWTAVMASFLYVFVGSLSVGFCKIILHQDRIEKHSIFGKRVMKRDDIGSLKKCGFGLTLLTYKYNSGDGMVFPQGLGGDAAWCAWMGEKRKAE